MRKSHTFSREQSTAIACVRHHQLQKSRIFKRHCRASTRKYSFSLKELKIHFTFATFSKFCPHYFGVNVTWEYLNLFLLIKHAFRPSKKKSSSNERQHWSDEYCILSIPKICFNCLILLFNSSCFFVTKQPLRTIFLLLVSAGLRRQNF